LGAPEHVDTPSSKGKGVHVPKCPAEAIASTVTIIDDKVSSVGAGCDDRALPQPQDGRGNRPDHPRFLLLLADEVIE
jgi:hypothetical protein